MLPRLSAAALAAAFCLPLPALACDAEEMNRHLNAVCHAALSPARQAIGDVLSHATEAERALIARALSRAEAACDTGDPRDGAAAAALLARLAGRIEARAGLALPLPDLAARF
jgi:acyl-CoA reductase-like NAD-dependent aldehyde dehydrogenase